MDIKQSPMADAIFTLSKLMKEHMTECLKTIHVSILQLQALVFLHMKKNAQMSEIANHFKIELPSATSLINKLVEMNLVTRKADKEDRRLVRISLTKQGETLLSEGLRARAKHMEHILSFLSQADKKELLRIIQKLIQALEKKHEK